MVICLEWRADCLQIVQLMPHTHTHTHFTALFPGLPRWDGTRKVKPIWILLKQETVSGSGISWTICKSAPRSRQITMPAPHRSVFYRPDALPATQPTAPQHWRSSWCHCITKPNHLLPRLNPDWFYLSGTGLPRLSWKRGHWMGVVVVVFIVIYDTTANRENTFNAKLYYCLPIRMYHWLRDGGSTAVVVVDKRPQSSMFHESETCPVRKENEVAIQRKDMRMDVWR